MSEKKAAVLYRMVLPDYTCRFGVRAKQMREDAGFEVGDRILSSRDEVDAFEEEQVDHAANLHRWRADRRKRQPRTLSGMSLAT